MKVDPMLEAQTVAKLKAWRSDRDHKAVDTALENLRSAAVEDRNIMESSIAAAKAGVTTGEWGGVLREVFGQYRGPTGVSVVMSSDPSPEEAEVRKEVERVSEVLGRTLTYVLGKPGLDGHSNGAEQIATKAKAVGMDVRYDGIRFTPEEIVAQAIEAKAHVVGLSILSGSHVDLVRDVSALMRQKGIGHIPLVVGGIIPPEDELVLKQVGVTRVYTPKDYKLNQIMSDIVKVVERSASETV
jgi:(2R)-ethylmalonyl-CoA mutase